MAQVQGKVYLVGAGPGDMAYLTIRGQQLLTQAEVIIYDALVHPQLLELASEDCLCLNVGKRGGQPSFNQTEIERLLVEYCQKGKRVVRLKNGDPMIFGRCTSEIRALKTAACDFEVIPGLSSALAVPLLAGIPLTDPVLSRYFAVLSAHDLTGFNWQTLAQIDTLVILMGGKRLPEIVQQLQQHGRSPHTPIAVIRWGGWAEQRVWLGILSDITDRTAGESLSPAVVIVGDVVGLQLQSCPANSLSEQREMEQNQLDLSQEGLNSPDPGGPQPQLALSGKTILVTRSATQSSEFSDRLTAAGANVITMPALVIGPPSTWEPLDAAIADLAEFDWLILTSTNGVEAFLDRLMYQGKDLRSLSGIQIAVVGRKTATSLIQRGLQPDFVPPDFIADALVKHFPQKGNLTGIKILFPRVETGGRDTLVAELTAKGANVVEAPAYQSCCPATIEPSVLEALQNQAVDAITFASSKTVQHFCQLLQQASQQIDKPSSLFEWQTWLAGVCIASIGPQTSKACNMLLGRVDLEASEYTLEGLMQSITNYYAGKAYPDSSRLEHDK